MRNVGSGHTSTAIESPAAALTVIGVILLAASFGIANGCGKHQEPVLQGDATKDASVQSAVMDAPLPAR